MNRNCRNPKPRKASGTAICEFGAGIWLIVLGFMFPCIQMMSLFASYACCFVLNTMQAEQAALLSQEQAQGFVSGNMVQSWCCCGLGRFAQVQQEPITALQYQEAGSQGIGGASSGPANSVTVSTSFCVCPLIQIPVLGMDKPITFTICSCRPVEDPNMQ